MSRRILVTEAMSDDGPRWLREHGYDVRYGKGIAPEELKEELQGCQGVIARLAELSGDVLSCAPELKVIARHGSGVDSVDLEYCREHGITVLRNVGTNSEAVAEYAVTLILACAKELEQSVRLYQNGEFTKARKQIRALELSGKTLGLVGFGNIARIVARICGLGFDMKVVAYDPYADEVGIPGYVTLTKDRDQVFQEADFISIHVPATSETKNSVGMKEFEKMKGSAYLINTSRGTVVNERELIEALEKGVIAGAGLDVTQIEPAEADNPLFAMKNVIMTPHCAGSSVEAKDKASMAAAKGCHAVLCGLAVEPPAFLV